MGNVTELKRRLLLAPEDVEARFALAEALFGERSLQPARTQLEKLLVSQPSHGNGLRLLSVVCRALGEAGAARRALQQLVEHAPDDADAHDTLAQALIEDERPDDALLEAQEAARRPPFSPQRYARCVALARSTGRLELARAHAERGLLRAPGEPELTDHRRWLLAELGVDDAFDLVAALDRADPLFEVREALIREDLAGAKKRVVAAAAHAEGRAELHLLRGELLLLEGQHERAQRSFEKARSCSPVPLVTGELAARIGRGVYRRLGVLGWGPHGGAVSPLEAHAVEGTGQLHFTGNVKGSGLEAGKLAFGLLKARAASWGLTAALGRRDLQLNFADAHLGKEGLSSGVALTLAGHAALKGRQVPARVAITGATSLAGEALRIQGIHEKLTAAFLDGYRTILAPRANRADVEALPRPVREALEVKFVTTVDEALQLLWPA
ncbi:MAG: S16 family serine protease [Archangium sp.]|nr:S16 family serine protease [Archangium sp.]